MSQHALEDTPARRSRRAALGALGALSLFGCGGGSSTTASTTATGSTSTSGTGSSGSGGSSSSSSGTCVAEVPSETAGPYPADGSNTNSGSVVDVISSSLVRQDITEGKTGLPMTLQLTLVNVDNSCAPVTNAAVYIWHCDKDGEYSAYTAASNGSHFGETFLRGIQVSDSNGMVTFTTIFPGWYTGRVTHIHFEIYTGDNLSAVPAKTSQLAFPEDIVKAVYALSSIYTKGQNTSVTSNAADGVFSDGTTYEMLTLTGDTSSGYTATLTVGLAL